MTASTITVNNSAFGTVLQKILLCDDIEPGSDPSYQACKIIYEYHPLGKKMVDAPIMMAQSQDRIINIQKGPEDAVREAFLEEWKEINADRYIANTRRLSRIYGVSAIALKVKGQKDQTPIVFEDLNGKDISFNCFDPLNIAGSVVLNQQPNDFDFLKTTGIAVQGMVYHPSRTVIIMNEEPIYLGWTTSAFGYVGRSCYQRALFPLKSFLQTMITDDMITRKAGLLVAMMKVVGSVVDNAMKWFYAGKRNLLKEGQTNNVLMVGHEDKIETLNMQNVDGAFGMARKNILENIAAADDMPAKILNAETFAEGFGEGTEDAKYVAQYIRRERLTMDPLYDFFDKIVMHRAWNEAFYQTIQKKYPETYSGVKYDVAFLDWKNSFKAEWPNLLEEPDSEKSKVEDVKLKAIIAMVEVLMPQMDPENKATLIQWAADNFNEFKLLFNEPLMLDYEALAEFTPIAEQAMLEPKPEAPFSSKDSVATFVKIDNRKRAHA